MTTSDTEPCAAPDAAVDDGLTDRERRWQDRVERGGVEVVRSPSAIDAADDCRRVSRERLRSLEADAARLPALERDLRDARAALSLIAARPCTGIGSPPSCGCRTCLARRALPKATS